MIIINVLNYEIFYIGKTNIIDFDLFVKKKEINYAMK